MQSCQLVDRGVYHGAASRYWLVWKSLQNLGTNKPVPVRKLRLYISMISLTQPYNTFMYTHTHTHILCTYVHLHVMYWQEPVYSFSSLLIKINDYFIELVTLIILKNHKKVKQG